MRFFPDFFLYSSGPGPEVWIFYGGVMFSYVLSAQTVSSLYSLGESPVFFLNIKLK